MASDALLRGVVIEVNCKTDFVFQLKELADDLAMQVGLCV